MGKNGNRRKRDSGTTHPAVKAMHEFFGVYGLDEVSAANRVLGACAGAGLIVGYDRREKTLYLRTDNLAAWSSLHDAIPSVCLPGVSFGYARGG